MNLKDHMLLWNHALIEIIDIRHTFQRSGDLNSHYQLPSSAFLLIINGKAEILIDEVPHEISNFHILHGGKGMNIQFLRMDELLEYYLILYKANLSLASRNNLKAIMEHNNPFNLQYGFTPTSPLPLFDKMENMFIDWSKTGILDRLYVKTLFYQWIYEMLRQLHTLETQLIQPDPLDQAIRYMQTYYKETFSLEKLAKAVNSSPRTLSRLFRTQLQTSPAQYLINIRMEKSKILLLNTEASLHDIAIAVGYPDGYYLGKMFKKYYGISPVRYKNKVITHSSWRDMPSQGAQIDIARTQPLRYIDYDNHYQYNGEGELPMFRNAKPSLLLTLLLCFTIVLSACSTGTTNSNASSNGKPTPSAETSTGANTDKAAVEAQTRIISTVKGDIAVPTSPQRVVVLYLLGDVLALGIKPIGVSDVSEGAAFEDELKDVQKLGTWFEASPEAILALNPDLIIVPSEETYEALHQIAPTVLVPYEKMSTEERVSFIGQVVGKEDQAKELFTDFHKKVEVSKQKLQEAGILDHTISIMEGGKDNSMAVVASKQFGRGSQIIYEYLGMKAPDIIQQKIDTATGADGESVSFEVLGKYSGDYIFRSSYDGMADLTQNPIWNNIPAVKEGRLMEIDFGLGYYSDIYSLNVQLDYIVEALLAAPRVK
ncbi:AraC family transcriptional regulator [Paenibacillus sp. FSL R5-0636]|uniref:ABC transporter substrate-binding protein n=1 Tax=Paenibacillus TaxID=44249 RepID=UPI00096EFA66|nr:ABC transporter substrate-binding protein [Paenibacillus odorifer]OMC94825.1 AraC family transcriptional regulator [Paenibacillus odorifer]OMC95244.1 AraC family transcriptional regulator [Paenibacillus odorifer]